MAKVTIIGKITGATEPEQGVSKAGREWYKQTFVVAEETYSQYSQYQSNVAVTVFGKPLCQQFVEMYDKTVEVSGYVESRQGVTGKWFTDVKGVSVAAYRSTQPQTQPQPQQPAPQTNDEKFVQQFEQGNVDYKELPF